jgi:hypothetical protein
MPKKKQPKKRKKKLRLRDWVAVSAWFMSGKGKHHNRTRDVQKGNSRKIKHKKNAEDE